MTYKVWNRVEAINGVNASEFLNREPFKSCKHDIILIYNGNGKVSQVECKEILASVYGIDKNLEISAFMTKYFETKEKQDQEVQEEV